MATDNTLTIAGIQQRCFTDKKRSWKQTEQHIQTAVAQGAELIVLQELHATQYFCQIESTDFFDLAEPIDGPTFHFLSQQAKQHQVVIVGSIFERRAPGLYHNTAIVLERDGSLAGFYRKMHIPDDPGFYEKFYFTPGDYTETQGFHPIDTSVGRLGVLVCWDQWYPEAARLMALRGADMLIYPTAIGWDPSDDTEEQNRQLDAWIIVQRGHSVANNLPVISMNRVGHEPDPSKQSQGIEFWGNSFMTGPQGEFLQQAQHQEETVLIAHLDRKRCEQVRRIWPYFRDRRVDAFKELSARYLDAKKNL